jgi:two-component system CheB/CheR fusion protein
LAEDAMEVLRTLIFIEKQIPTKDGSWFSIRIMPYRTFDDRIDGLVITFINISDLKQVAEELNETHHLNQLLLNSSPDIILKLSTDWKILEFNSVAEKFFGKKRIDVTNQNFMELFVPEPFRKKTEHQMIKLLKQKDNNKFNMKVIANEATETDVEWSVRVLHNNLHMPSGIILTTIKLK